MNESDKPRCSAKCAGRSSSGRREAVSKAAVTLFAKKGFHATSTAEVAKLAGVSEGTIFYYFGSKEGILLDLLVEVNVQYRQRMDKVLQKAPDGMSAMLACVEFHFKQVRQHSRLLALLVRDLPVSLGRGDSKCRRTMRQQTALIIEVMSQGLRMGQADGSVAADLPVAETALLIRSMLIGATRLLLLKLAPDVDFAGQAVDFCRRALTPGH
ncbi:MAG: TetR/AcrR family transcriptional regulator [Pseudomonadota bacterium]